MALRTILTEGEDTLYRKSREVVKFDDRLHALLDDMAETMYHTNGVGLAANQVGRSLRLFVYDCPDENGDFQRGCVINPVLETSEIPKGMPADDGTDDEGCLSVPGIDFPTGRAERATVTGLDENGEPVTVVGTGLLARCLQHEVGHLDGLLYTDVLTGRWKRAAKKEFKARGWNEPGRTWMPGVDEDPFGHEGPGTLDKGQGEAQSEGQGEGQPEGQAE